MEYILCSNKNVFNWFQGCSIFVIVYNIMYYVNESHNLKAVHNVNIISQQIIEHSFKIENTIITQD